MLDTNVISHVVKQSPGWDRIAANYDKARRAGSQLTMSIMSVYEIRKGLLLGESGRAKMKMTTRANMGLMMGSFQWFNFDGYAAESAARVAAIGWAASSGASPWARWCGWCASSRPRPSPTIWRSARRSPTRWCGRCGRSCAKLVSLPSEKGRRVWEWWAIGGIPDGSLSPRTAAAMMQAYCRLLVGWMAKSGFRDGCPISTTLLESAPQSQGIALAGREAALKACPDPDILINNAGGPPPGDFRNWTRDDWIKAIDANMLTPIELIKATVDGMIARKFGRIVNITSGSVKMPLVGLDLSSGARAGLTAFFAGVARSVAASNVTINFLLPGTFDTERLRSNIASNAKNKGVSFDEAKADRIASVPARRFGQPDDCRQPDGPDAWCPGPGQQRHDDREAQARLGRRRRLGAPRDRSRTGSDRRLRRHGVIRRLQRGRGRWGSPTEIPGSPGGRGCQ